MQHCSITLRIQASEQAHPIDVVKQDVTVPEIALLMAMHGPDRVFDIKPIYWKQTTSRAEMERLARFYRPEIVAGVFPGVSPRLPLRLVDIGFAPGAKNEPAPPMDLPAGDEVSRQAEETQRRIKAAQEVEHATADEDDPAGEQGDGGDGLGNFDEAEGPAEPVAPIPAVVARLAPQAAQELARQTGARIIGGDGPRVMHTAAGSEE